MNDQKKSPNNKLNDLTVANDQQSEIKGGPTPKSKRDLLLKSSVTAQDGVLGDLEPAGDVTGGAPSSTCGTWRCGFNHNETVVNDTDGDALQDLPLQTLNETDSDYAEEIKGGQHIKKATLTVRKAGGDQQEY